ncbi:ABC transporter substrate-binding protein [Streptomyces mayteni]
MSVTRRTPASPSPSPSRRQLLTALGALGLGAATAGCGRASADGTVTLDFQWWGSDTRNLATDEAVRLFERRYPTIRVDTSFTSYDAYFQRLATQVAAGSGPDVLQMDYYQLRSYADRGLLADLESPEFTDLSLDGVADTYVASNRVDGTLYAVPTGLATQAIFADPAVWQAAGVELPRRGWTWDDLLDDVGPALRRALPDRYPLTDFGGYTETFNIWLVQRGKSIYDADGEPGFTTADLTEFWELTARLRDASVLTAPHITTSYDGSTESSPLLRELSTAEWNITSGATHYAAALGDVALLPFPTMSSGAPLGLTALPGAMCVQQRSAHKREVALLLDFLLNDPEAADALGVVRGLPAGRANLDRLAPELSGGDRSVYEYVLAFQQDFGTPYLPPPGSDEDKLEFERVYQGLIFGEQTVREAATEMVDKFHSTVPQG